MTYAGLSSTVWKLRHIARESPLCNEMNVRLRSRALYGSGISKANESYCGIICLQGTRAAVNDELRDC